MDSNLRFAWTEVVTAADYDAHMAAIGQAQAAAALTDEIFSHVDLRADNRVIVIGAGTGQVFDYMNAALLQPVRLICTDLNPNFLARLKERLERRNLRALILVDDIENTALRGGPDLLLATLLLEHIDWRKGVEAIVALAPRACGIVIQENPEGMTSAVTPGRCIPASIAAAFKIAHPKLIARDELLRAFESRGYHCALTRTREVADGKRLIALLFHGDPAAQLSS